VVGPPARVAVRVHVRIVTSGCYMRKQPAHLRWHPVPAPHSPHKPLQPPSHIQSRLHPGAWLVGQRGRREGYRGGSWAFLRLAYRTPPAILTHLVRRDGAVSGQHEVATAIRAVATGQGFTAHRAPPEPPQAPRLQTHRPRQARRPPPRRLPNPGGPCCHGGGRTCRGRPTAPAPAPAARAR